MASRIAGITVEIGGDTTKLSKALEGVNKSIKTTQSELKDVNKLLKLDPSNTEAVTQKQRMLKEAIEATKEKLTTLKTAAQQANEQLADGKITQEQYDALQREIVETEEQLKSLQEQAAVTNATLAKIDAVGDKLQSVGSKVEDTGKKFLPVTAAVTGLGTAAVKTAADFDAEMSKVAAISGATGDDFDQLRAKAREMGAKTKFSASEAASAMEYMAMAGWKTGDKKRYEGLAGCKDYKKAVQLIKVGGYATSLTYVQNLCSVIERWNLTQYDVAEAATSTSLYRVRKSWSDTASQKGAFRELSNAKAYADKNPGYSVFDGSGNMVYAAANVPTSFQPYKVRISISDLNIRKGPGTNYGSRGYTGKGVFTIVEESTGKGATKWGLLKSYASKKDGWVSLDYAKKV